jgi:hypothetical protein
VAEAILRHRAGYIQKHAPNGAVRSLLGLLPLCRTAALGGHLYRCSQCGHEQPRYNSCGNRHCPVCQVMARERWVAQQEASLLDVPYFHMVFTLPAEVQPLLLQNKATGYNLLFRSVAETLLQFGRDPAHGLQGQLGFTAVLHTWNQTLGPHAHLHVLIPAGALKDDKTAFIRSRGGRWLFPVKALSRVFRAVFLKGLKRIHDQGALAFHGKLAGLNDAHAFAAHLEPLYRKPWVVYAKRPFAGPRQVIAYLGRYTHRVAISNARILKVTGRHVCFSYRDPQRPDRKKTMQLEGPEFLRRFFLHILPHRFTRIRHYGFLGNAVRKANVPLIRGLIGQPPPEPADESPIERIERVYGIDLCACPHCTKGRMQPVQELPPHRGHDPPKP